MAQPTETVTLRNRTAVMLPPLHLPHADVCAMSGTCVCQVAKVGVRKMSRKGKRALVIVSKRLPSTLTLAARNTEGDTLKGLSLHVLHAPDVARLVASKRIEVTRVSVPSDATATPVTEKPVTPAPTASTTPAPSAKDPS